MNAEQLTNEYHKMRLTYERLKDEALYILEQELSVTELKLHSLLSRVKSLDSLLDKIERKQLENPLEEIHDVVGIRVVCLFLSDIDRVESIIRKVFSVLEHDNKIDGSEVSSFGYMSVHFIVKMKKEYKGPRYNALAELKFEIQVRTIAMDAWANVSHYLDYKSDVDVPKELKRDFHALSGLFYVADRHFEIFMKSTQDSRTKMVAVFEKEKHPLNQDLNLDTLNAYLLNRFPDRKHSKVSSISELLTELSGVGITSLKEIDGAIDAAMNAFEEYEKDIPPNGRPGSKYETVGVIRGVFDLVHPLYQKNREVSMQDIEKYVSLFKKNSTLQQLMRMTLPKA